MSNLDHPSRFSGRSSTVFGGAGYDEDLAAGISAGFGVVGYRGRTWSIRYKGEEKPLNYPNTDDPLNSLELIIIKAPNHLSKTFYETGWTQNASAPPDCASSNGIVPDAGVPKKQNDVCITCKQNQFGAKPVQPGQTQAFKGKPCADNKRLAVVPLGNILNEQYGGPLLLRVPPMSLGDLSNLGNLLKQIGFPYYAAGIKISFDTTVSYPKFIFKLLRRLTEAEGKIVNELRELDITDKIIHGDTPPSTSAEPIVSSQKAAPVPDNVVTMPKQQAQPTTPSGFGSSTENKQNGTAPAQEPVTTGVPQFDAALDKKLEGLL